MTQYFETALVLFVNVIISFAAGCATRRKDYYRAMLTPWAMVVCVVMQFVVRPAVVYGLLIACSVPDSAAVGFMLCAMAPGGNGSNLLEIIFRGNVELGIVCTLCSSLAASVMIPVDFYLYARRFADDSFSFATMPWGDLCAAVACVVCGATLGAGVRYADDGLGRRLEKCTAVLGVTMLVAAVVIAVLSNPKSLRAIPRQAWLAAAFPCPLSLALAYAAAKLFGLGPTDCRTVAIEVGECNIGVAYAILLLLYKNDEDQMTKVLSGLIAYTAFNEVYIFGIAFYWRKISPIRSKPKSKSITVAQDEEDTEEDCAGDSARTASAQADEPDEDDDGGAASPFSELPAGRLSLAYVPDGGAASSSSSEPPASRESFALVADIELTGAASSSENLAGLESFALDARRTGEPPNDLISCLRDPPSPSPSPSPSRDAAHETRKSDSPRPALLTEASLGPSDEKYLAEEAEVDEYLDTDDDVDLTDDEDFTDDDDDDNPRYRSTPIFCEDPTRSPSLTESR